MRFLAIAFSLSLLGGCVDELGDEGREPGQTGVDDIDETDTNTDGTNNLPDPRCDDGPLGKGGASRKKADGSSTGCL